MDLLNMHLVVFKLIIKQCNRALIFIIKYILMKAKRVTYRTSLLDKAQRSLWKGMRRVYILTIIDKITRLMLLILLRLLNQAIRPAYDK